MENALKLAESEAEADVDPVPVPTIGFAVAAPLELVNIPPVAALELGDTEAAVPELVTMGMEEFINRPLE